MSEKKKCPILQAGYFAMIDFAVARQVNFDFTKQTLCDCIEEKCVWWVHDGNNGSQFDCAVPVIAQKLL